MMDDATRALIVDLFSPLIGAASLGVMAWALSKLPGPMRDALAAAIPAMTSATHARDVAVLVGTMARRATAEVANHGTPAPTAAEVVEYTQRVRGDLMQKMGVSDEGMQTMAAAAIAVAEKVAAPDAVVVPVVVDPTRP